MTRSQFYPQQNERLKEQTRREVEFDKIAKSRFNELEQDRIEDIDDLDFDSADEFEDDNEPIDAFLTDEEDDEFHDIEQPLLKFKILNDRNPIRHIVVTLDENLCQILPFNCSLLFKTFYLSAVFEYTGEYLKIIDITDGSNSIYDNYKSLITPFNKNMTDKQSFVDGINKLFFDMEWIDFNIRKKIVEGMVLDLNNLLIIETKNKYDKKLGGPLTIMLDFEEIVYKNKILPDVLYPQVTIYRCSRSLDNNVKCSGTEECSEKCRFNYI